VTELDVEEFLSRFRDRAAAVAERGIPPLEGEARRAFMAAAEKDFLDYSLVGNASWTIEEGHLVLRVPLAR